MTRSRITCRVAAGLYLVVVLLAVLWDSGSQIGLIKDALGPWFLNAEGKDVVLNLVMLAPLTLLAHLGWPRIAWWRWALAGCALGAGAELAQWALPFLTRRAAWANVAENAVGAWVGALAAHIVRRTAGRTSSGDPGVRNRHPGPGGGDPVASTAEPPAEPAGPVTTGRDEGPGR